MHPRELIPGGVPVRPQLNVAAYIPVPGVQGPPGSGAPYDEDFSLLVSGVQSVMLRRIPLPGTLTIFLNGLKAAHSEYSIVQDAVILLAGLSPTEGDTINLNYLYTP